MGAVVNAFKLLRRRERREFLAIVVARVSLHSLDLLGVAAVGLLGGMIAAALEGASQVTFLGGTFAIESQQSFVTVAALAVAFFVLKSALGAVLLRVTSTFLARVESESAVEISQYLFTGDLARVRSLSRGEIQWAVYPAVSTGITSMLYSGAILVTEATLLLVMLAGFFIIDPQAGLYVAAYFALLTTGFQLIVGGRLKRLGQRLRTNSVVLNNSILDMASVFREATVLNKRDHFLKRFAEVRTRQALDNGLQRFVLGLPRFVIEAFLMLGVFTLLIWQATSASTMDLLVFTGVFLAGGTRMMAAVLPIQNALTEVRIQRPTASRAHQLISEARSVQTLEKAHDETTTAGRHSNSDLPFAVTVRGLSFSYPGADHETISGLDFSVESGEFMAIIGPSGAGKSTVVDLLLGIHDPQEGEITICGRRPARLIRDVPGSVSYVPQSPGMISGSVEENVALGHETIDTERVRHVLGEAGLWSHISTLSNGLQTPLSHERHGLSGGQIQRLGLARALYTNPKLLVLDEATSALDAETEATIMESLERLRGNTTIVVVAHRLSTVQRADNLIVMEKGRILAIGKFDKVRRDVPFVENFIQLMAIKGSDC